MDKATQVSVECSLAWNSLHARHTDRYFVEKVNFWRDIFPGSLGDQLSSAETGASVSESFHEGEVTPRFESAKVRQVGALHMRLKNGTPVQPRPGRFYPRGLLSNVAGIYPQDKQPFRYLGSEEAGSKVDLNHPLARYPLAVEARLVSRLGGREERGGRCNDIGEMLTDNGPGLQADFPEVVTDYYSNSPFARDDEQADTLFYIMPRMVDHIDAVARSRISALYGRFLRPGMRVLDLMSSWNSHLPGTVSDLRVTGVGLNEEELRANKRLSDFTVHDLNRDPRLPLPEGEYDAAICTVSVEYMVKPFEIFREVARVLKPGAPYVVTFSERWFPPKVVRVWQELHPFERMGLVVDYFRRDGSFGDLETESLRGLLRPADDKYAGLTPFSDPVYAVWGRVLPR